MSHFSEGNGNDLMLIKYDSFGTKRYELIPKELGQEGLINFNWKNFPTQGEEIDKEPIQIDLDALRYYQLYSRIMAMLAKGTLPEPEQAALARTFAQYMTGYNPEEIIPEKE